MFYNKNKEIIKKNLSNYFYIYDLNKRNYHVLILIGLTNRLGKIPFNAHIKRTSFLKR